MDFNNRLRETVIRGETTHGTDGLVLLNREKDNIEYIPLQSITDSGLHDKISDMLTEQGNQFVFVLEESGNQSFNIWKFSRTFLLQ